MIRNASAGDGSALAWFKSSYSDGTDGNSCVELALTPHTVHVRDSKHLEGPRLALAPSVWARFTVYVSQGRPGTAGQ
ncbi:MULTISPECIES: DUF397 domain-containing protein [Streptomyces]|jgi:hypothetical protein|uniref:DUF397 domain-containing protein n=1 Tax=Streptomyces TaxID=1883 RepID=UPI001F2A3223|nr:MULTISPECIES: DUF397 domain-containing protein [Streptomyces]MCF0088889.1 hypothetical protein [Streptomyces sp. MH192]MCF0098907.1 hypothetical protein [Streptomyces sp. MH191]MDX3089720.1 DUF397 domain-containing protein [Streptomyces sp. ME12-02E]MDX3333186.1 DUF397 domain-containing protein [Streptomyces sp. ME02-6978a]WTI28325.1 DUF397 domain-containing protein [Streptomyces jietaisiensis]